MRRIKIIATIKPSATPERITRLLQAGLDVARLDFAHGSHQEHSALIDMLRAAASTADKPLAIMQALQGPTFRTGSLVGHAPVTLVTGEHLTLTSEPIAGTIERVSTTYSALPRDARVGDQILLADGTIELQVVRSNDADVETEIVFGGELHEHQRMHFPGVQISAATLTEKDLADLAFGVAQGVDYVVLPFVRRARDIIQAKERIAGFGRSVPLIATIEKAEALDDLAAILAASDGIVVARSDLGIEIPTEQVPVIQKHVIEAANAAGKPVITATQMLDSMASRPRPTRAEAGDVANAIIDGSDALMLDGEVASGNFSVEAIGMMTKIAEVTEASGQRGDMWPLLMDPQKTMIIEPKRTTADAISAAAVAIVQTLRIKAIVAFTMSGSTARAVANLRPDVPIYAFTPNRDVYNQLNLVWGIEPILCQFTSKLDDLQSTLERIVVERGLVAAGDKLVMTGGHPIAGRGATNFLKVFEVGSA